MGLEGPTCSQYHLCCAVVFAGNSSSGQLAYVGHSQGTTQMFAALSSSPALRARLSLAVMLAPAVHMRHIQALPLQVLAAMDADKVRIQCCLAG